MTFRAAFAGALSLLALCGAGTATGAESITEKTGVNALLGVSPSTPDFIRGAEVADMFETETAALAREKGDDATKNFVEKLAAVDAAGPKSLRAVMAENGLRIDPPEALDLSAQSRVNALKALSGEAFDSRFRDDQIKALKEEVDLFERYAGGGDNDALKRWAADALPRLRARLDLAEKL